MELASYKNLSCQLTQFHYESVFHYEWGGPLVLRNQLDAVHLTECFFTVIKLFTLNRWTIHLNHAK